MCMLRVCRCPQRPEQPGSCTNLFIHLFIFETGSYGADFGPQLVEDDLILLMFLPSGYWDYRCVSPCLILFGAGDGTQGVMIDR